VGTEPDAREAAALEAVPAFLATYLRD